MSKRKLDKPPPPMVTLTARGLSPIGPYDAELLNSFSNGTEFDLVKRSKRSNPHLRTYWKALGDAVKATGVSASQDHLHLELKLACKYTQKVLNRTTDEVIEMPDSIAFEQMAQDEFKAYFDASMAMLASWIGYDPLRFMEAA